VLSGATDAAFSLFVGTLGGNSPLAFDVVTTLGASAVTLRWRLDASPAAQPRADRRTLLKYSRNAITITDIVDAESDTYQTPSGITWALLEDEQVLQSGTFTSGTTGWRAEVSFEPEQRLGSGLLLRVVATLASATWTRDTPIYVSESA
jgi:hypothetical protein